MPEAGQGACAFLGILILIKISSIKVKEIAKYNLLKEEELV
jgi:hypothetical protein